LPVSTGQVHWRAGSGDVTAIPGYDWVEPLRGQLESANRDLHVLIQIDESLGTNGKQSLRECGLTLLTPLGHRWHYARISSAADLDRMRALQGVLHVSTIDPKLKLHPALNRDQQPDWLALPPAERGRIPLYVMFHEDVPVNGMAAQVFAPMDGVVRSLVHSVNTAVVELPWAQVQDVIRNDSVRWVEPPLPAFGPANDGMRMLMGVDGHGLEPPDGLGLNGTGVSVMVYDGGGVLPTHPDLIGRVNERDSISPVVHATHVAGTLGGSGAGSYSAGGEPFQWRGVAPGVIIESYSYEASESGIDLYSDPGDLESDYDDAINTFQVDLSNNSIGSNVCSNFFPCEITGDYGATAALLDAIVGGSLGRPLPIVWAAGNERKNVGVCPGGHCCRCVAAGVHTFDGYHSTAPPACAKNPIVVGAVYSDTDEVTMFSSFGPCDDGRLRPDVVAPGCQLTGDEGITSSVPAVAYQAICGTSMATPAVTGLTALLIEEHRRVFPGEDDLLNATLKALLIHAAQDIGAEGPDYQTGYGSVRLLPAVELIGDEGFLEDTIEHGLIKTFLVSVDWGDEELKVTLVWDDAPGAPELERALVNDIDVRVIDPESRTHWPWTLDAALPAAPAVRLREDRLNNVEQVVVRGSDMPSGVLPIGMWVVQVVGHDIATGVQTFSLTATPTLSRDCDEDGLPDDAEIAADPSLDCTGNGTLDTCEPDCDGDGAADTCEIAAGSAEDCNDNHIDDACEPDCNGNDVPDDCDLVDGSSPDCNDNTIPDECDIAAFASADCNDNQIPDECDIASGTSPDCNANGIPDDCIDLEDDCNVNLEPDSCDITDGVSQDCDASGIPDECEIDIASTAPGGPFFCDVALKSCAPDCNGNGVPDSCDIESAVSFDCNADGVPDECHETAEDCNDNLEWDFCDIFFGVSEDFNQNDIPDECEDTERIIYVNAAHVGIELGTQSNPFRNIADAVDVAISGNEIRVAPDLYAGVENRDLDPAGRTISMICESDEQACIIDAQSQGRGLHIHSGESREFVFRGFTIRNGFSSRGGGVLIEDASPTIQDCVIEQNVSTGGGGGIACIQGMPLLDRCIIRHNECMGRGGGVEAVGGPQLVRCTVTENVADGSAGGIFAGSDTVVVDSTIENNSAGTYGGGLELASRARIERCTIANNAAQVAGGGINCLEFSRPLIRDSIFQNNEAVTGGAIHAVGSSANVEFCTIVNNFAETAAGVHVRTADSETASVRLNHTILWDNDSDDDNLLRVEGTEEVPATLIVSWSDVQSIVLLSDIYEGPLADGAVSLSADAVLAWNDGNFSIDPMLLLSEHSVMLDDDSPCINAGHPSFIAQSDHRDHQGDRRIIGGRADVGADERRRTGDFDGDGNTDLVDFLQFSLCFTGQCLDESCIDPSHPLCTLADDDGDGDVDLSDFGVFQSSFTGPCGVLITEEPIGQNICAGLPLQLSVSAFGLDLGYQWRRNGVPIPNSDSPVYEQGAATGSDGGEYDVIATDSCSSIRSRTVNVTVGNPLEIVTQPMDQTVCAKMPLVLAVFVTGSGAPVYQWMRDGTPIPGAETFFYTVPQTDAADAGTYTVRIEAPTNPCGEVMSQPALVQIIDCGLPGL
jgi:subtilisin family serine protease